MEDKTAFDKILTTLLGKETITVPKKGKPYTTQTEPNIVQRATGAIKNGFNDILGKVLGAIDSSNTATPTPTPTATPTPVDSGFRIPNVPNDVAQVIGQVMANQGVPMDATASAKILNHSYGQQIKGWGIGENPDFKTILDVPNRLDENGNWDDNAPIKQILNPETGQMENSVDRGLWRINNASFYDYKRRFPEVFKQYGINSYEDMNDPLKNTVVAKLIIQNQGGAGYYAAPIEMANFGKLY